MVLKLGSKHTFQLGALIPMMLVFFGVSAVVMPESYRFNSFDEKTTTDDLDTADLKYNIKKDPQNPYSETNEGGKFLSTPSNVKTNVDYDPESGNYNISKTVGDEIPYQPPTYMGFDEYINYSMEKSKEDYWKEKIEEDKRNSKKGYRPDLGVQGEAVDKIFGSSAIDIKPNGSAELIFGIKHSFTDNPSIPVKQRRNTIFDFDEKIQLNVIGNIGDKLKLTTSYNTESTFDFENQMKLEYTGYEDDILQSIEAGNVTLPLRGSLITGSQSLFGLKTKLKFGRLTVTSVFASQKGKKSEVSVQGGAQISEFILKADRYEQNKHFFLSHFFRDHYEEALTKPPFINTGAQVTKVEVWVTNIGTNFDNNRNIISFQDLGEASPQHMFNPGYVLDASADNPDDINTLLPSNDANDLYPKFKSNTTVRNFSTASSLLIAEGLGPRDYQRVQNSRKLEPTEFTFHPQLGYISLSQEMSSNQVLSVAFQYTYQGKLFQVGDFTTDISSDNALYLKMLKSTELNTKMPMWDLMMKNIYSVGTYNVKEDGFQVEVWYLNANTGVDINYMPEGDINGIQLLKVLNLDRLSVNQQARPDGVFDFLDNPLITINPKNGRIIFPVLEPFGSHLHNKFNNEDIAKKFAFDSLYTNTQANAMVKFPDKNRFTIKGKYKSAQGSEISLGAINIPKGSVVVTAGGQVLVEDQDYTVDYALGRVTIINNGVLESGVPIKVVNESNSMFGVQNKTMFANRFDYTISDDFIIGGTLMNLRELPLTQKVNIGNEPMSNTIWGLDGNYKTESRFITAMVDKIPLINTKEKSTIQLSGEFAQLVPGHSKAVNLDEGGTAYVDDFEGSQSSIELRTPQTNWQIASVPQGQKDMFPEGSLFNDLRSGFNRAKLSWYIIDASVFFRGSNITPQNIKDDDSILSNHFMREVYETEVFPNKQIAASTPQNLTTLDMAFYPNEKGPYNFDVEPTNYSAGMAEDGTLNNPQSRWGGIMRRIETTDFDAANIEFIQFWVMDPFAEETTPGFPNENTKGQLYFNIGDVAEDVLRDGTMNFENGWPTSVAATEDLSGENASNWSRTPTQQYNQVLAFDNSNNSRELQDIGFDGLRDEEEQVFYADYIARVDSLYPETSAAYAAALLDPSTDNYNFYRDDDYDVLALNILDRYKKFNGLEGNSASDDISKNLNTSGYTTSASTRPDIEDINLDGNMNEVERYFQYRVDISKNDISPDKVGSGYITDMVEAVASTPLGQKAVKWYQFKIPIKEYEKAVGGITDFRSIRFMRIYMKGFNTPVFLRFARLQLIRGEWRRYSGNDMLPQEEIVDDKQFQFNIAAVNVEENSDKVPVNYILPPGIERQQSYGVPGQPLMNEQSLSMDVCGLPDGREAIAYKNVNFDFRSYKKLKMFVHAEASNGEILDNDDLRIFIRLGSDFEQNYFEYEIPLEVTLEGFYNQSSADEEQPHPDQYKVWPELNQVIIDLDRLADLKTQRNMLLKSGAGEVSVNKRYSYVDNGEPNAPTYVVVGNPNINTVKTIMIGIRNPKKGPTNPDDDGYDKCAEIWVNELRVADYDQTPGYAAIGRATVRLADLATVSLSGSWKTPGFGSVETKVSERSRETTKQMDVSTSVELGKFLPEQSGVKVPMYMGYSETWIDPQYSPLEPGNLVSNVTSLLTEEEANHLTKEVFQDNTIRKSMNFTNVRKEKGKNSKKSHFYDISNFSATYAYSEIARRNIDLQKDLTKTYKGGLTYTFNNTPKNYAPFKNIGFIKKYNVFALIRDFNFYLVPKQLGFMTDMNRMYNERMTRNNFPGITADVDPFYNKNFTWGRSYSLNHDFAKGLKFDFNANNAALIMEPEGRVDKNDEDNYKEFKDTVMNSIRQFGSTTTYRHSSNINYTIPINKIPIFNWVTSSAKYTANYSWDRAPFAAENFGNTIQNSNNLSINATGNMSGLYGKVPYLKKVSQKFASSGKGSTKPKSKTPDKNAAAPSDSTKTKKKEKKDITIVDHAVNFLMGLKNVSGTYTENRGILMPGYNNNTQLIGMSPGFDAPGFGYIFGQQSGFGNSDTTTHFSDYAASKGWLAKEPNLNIQYAETYTKNIQGRATFEPIKDLRIEFNATQQSGQNNSSFYRWGLEQGETDSSYFNQTPIQTGTYSISYNTIRTAFGSENSDSSLFETFRNNRKIISKRLSIENENSGNLAHSDEEGYFYGYGETSTDVLIPAFLAAYSGKSAQTINLNPFKTIMKPNWTVKYNGLSKLPALKKYLKSFTLNHAYRSTFNMGSFTNNLNYGTDANYGKANVLDQNMNFVAQNQIGTITISEQFSPLINFDMTWNNSLLSRFEIKKDRSLSMSFANTQLTEVQSMEYVIGMGYNFKKIPFPFELKPGQKISSDLNCRLDFSIRKNETYIRKAVENTYQLTQGQSVYTIKFTADYKLTDKLNLRFYYDRVANAPKISTSYKTRNTNAGISLRFALSS